MSSSSPVPRPPAGVFFDLDGTIADTFGDIAAAVQAFRADLGAGPLADPEILRHIGWGAPNLIAQCHPSIDHLRPDRLPPDGGELPVEEAEVKRCLALFREAYDRDLLVHTSAYEGIPELCEALTEAGVKMAVVSNKPEGFVRKVIVGLGLVDFFAIVLGGDSLPERKPSALPLLHAAREVGVDPARSVMVGDSRLDVECARASGAAAVAVAWGLHPRAELEQARPDAIVETVAELQALLLP